MNKGRLARWKRGSGTCSNITAPPTKRSLGHQVEPEGLEEPSLNKHGPSCHYRALITKEEPRIPSGGPQAQGPSVWPTQGCQE